MSLIRGLNFAKYRNDMIDGTAVLAGDVTGTTAASKVVKLQNLIDVGSTPSGLSIKIGDTLGNMVGGGNTCYGSGAGDKLQNGTSNTCIGWLAGSEIISGSNNICLGQNQSHAGSVKNIYIGDAVAASKTAGAGNIFIGHSNSQSSAFSSIESVCIGRSAEAAVFGNSNAGVCIGLQSGINVTEGIAIGAGARASAWVLNTSCPLAIGGTCTALIDGVAATGIPNIIGGAAPAAGPTNRLRIRINNVNYCVALYADQ